MPLAAVGQFCATSDAQSNLETCVKLIQKAAQHGALMIFLPEASDFIPLTSAHAVSQTSVTYDDFVKSLRKAASDYRIWISVAVHEPSTTTTHIHNNHLIIDSDGEVKASYRKLHLFDVEIEDGPRFLESDFTLPGKEIVEPLETPIGLIGLQTCYDLRFPELSAVLRMKGADILTFPSAFAVKTGQAHWEVLLRARAIETQTYVIASAQNGTHNEKRASYGKSMIVDPWGTVLCCCPDTTEPTIAIAKIDLQRMMQIRRNMPMHAHRRTDLFPHFGNHVSDDANKQAPDNN